MLEVSDKTLPYVSTIETCVVDCCSMLELGARLCEREAIVRSELRNSKFLFNKDAVEDIAHQRALWKARTQNQRPPNIALCPQMQVGSRHQSSATFVGRHFSNWVGINHS